MKMNRTIGFIGCGNMAQAMIGGIIKSKLVSPENLIVSNRTEGKLNYIKEKYNTKITLDNKDVASFSDILILAVKPNMYIDVITEIKDFVKPNVIIVTIATGITIETVEKTFDKAVRVVRTMPNTPALVGEGMSAVCHSNLVNAESLQHVINIFESFGKVELLSEKLLDAIPAISGSSPAYTFMFIEALADGGVLQGIPRDKAYRLAAQAVLGAAKMILETGEHPGSLKDKVCSPGGTTIEAVYTLEKNNFRGAVISAMESCTEKAIKMSKNK
jgi:pyrroline-5-carboxylate reductase